MFAACAGAALYRRGAVLGVGGFDERFFAYLEDVDLGLRLRLAGWRCALRARVARHAGRRLPGSSRGRCAWVARNTLLLVARPFRCAGPGRALPPALVALDAARGGALRGAPGRARGGGAPARRAARAPRARAIAVVPVGAGCRRRRGGGRGRRAPPQPRVGSARPCACSDSTSSSRSPPAVGVHVAGGGGPHDEGLMLAAAERIAGGEWPYRDFWWNYGPGQAYVLGALTSFTGPSLIAWRIVRVAIDAMVALLVARLVADRAGSGRMPAPAARDRRGRGHGVADRARTGAPALALGLRGCCWPATPAGPGGWPASRRCCAPRSASWPWRPCARAPAAGAPPFAVSLVSVPAVLPVARGDLLDQTAGFLGIQDLQRLPFPFDPAGLA